MIPRPVTIGERIVVHLSQYARHFDAYVCPRGMAQAGISDALGISRAHTAIELRRQIDAGRVLVRIAHVTGVPTRRKVYHLTTKGGEVARIVRDRALRRAVVLVLPDGTEEPVPGGRVLEALREEGVAEGRAVLLTLTRDRIDLRENLRGGPLLPEARLRSAFDQVFYGPVAWQFQVVLGPPHVPPVPAAA